MLGLETTLSRARSDEAMTCSGKLAKHIHVNGDNRGDKASGKLAMHNHIKGNKKKETMADEAYGRPRMHTHMVRDKRGMKCRREKCPEIQQCTPTGGETRGETDGGKPAMHTNMKGNDGRV